MLTFFVLVSKTDEGMGIFSAMRNSAEVRRFEISIQSNSLTNLPATLLIPLAFCIQF
jgi:hypothetical protein